MADAPRETVAKWQRVADLLIKLTASGQVKWSETASKGKFVATFGGNTVAITEQEDGGGGRGTAPLIRIEILDFVDDVVDEFTDEDLGDQYYLELRNMLRIIERKASGADAVLDEIIEELDKMDPDSLPF